MFAREEYTSLGTAKIALARRKTPDYSGLFHSTSVIWLTLYNLITYEDL